MVSGLAEDPTLKFLPGENNLITILQTFSFKRKLN